MRRYLSAPSTVKGFTVLTRTWPLLWVVSVNSCPLRAGFRLGLCRSRRTKGERRMKLDDIDPLLSRARDHLAMAIRLRDTAARLQTVPGKERLGQLAALYEQLS